MTKSGQNVTMYQGDYRILEVTVLDENDAPRDVTGCLVTWVVYKPTTKFVELTKIVGSGISAPVGAVFEITLEPEDTLNLLGQYNHECEITDGSSHPFTILTGYFKVFSSEANLP